MYVLGKGLLSRIATGLTILGVSMSVHAADSASLELGAGDKVQFARVGVQWDWNKKWFQSNGTHISGYWDASLAQLRATKYRDDPNQTQHITMIGLTPMFRYERDSKTGFYAEGGIGAHLMSELYDNNGDRLSTAFQFGDQVGVGYVFQNKLDVGFKLLHFSNGGIKNPNSGINLAVLRASYPF